MERFKTMELEKLFGEHVLALPKGTKIFGVCLSKKPEKISVMYLAPEDTTEKEDFVVLVVSENELLNVEEYKTIGTVVFYDGRKYLVSMKKR